ncbi:MAG: FIG045085: Hypothetical protein [uncultured Adhaeribacter sp.]|uniref:DUF4175 family protein n=1 Tax=uncultured Adhaeribacter sp. TaxID=448109 RepID=A0A6J4HV44_9BACT|nr:MAG: FIG045085: Hypothetical protein [uncultured Adhaeribacter sp.]
MSGSAIISKIKQSYFRRKLASYGLLLLAFTVVLLTVYLRWQPTLRLNLVLLLVWVAGFYFLVQQIKKIYHLSPVIIAQHLNRTQPNLEESCHLLLTPPESLTMLERLQVQRLTALLQVLNPAQAIIISDKKTWFTLFISLVIAGLMFLVPALPSSTGAVPIIASIPENQLKNICQNVPQIQTITIRVSPPAYTRRQAYTVNQPNFKAEAGSRITWQIQTTAEISNLHLTLSSQRRLTFRKEKNIPHQYTLTFTPASSFIYTLDVNTSKSDFYAAELLPDQNPVISIQQPKPFTELLFGEAPNVALVARLTDDYGLRKASIVATTAQGSGESVKFREIQYPLSLPKNQKEYTFRKNIDLKALGLTYGDELYFYVQAQDNNRGYTRSESYLIQLEDTTVVTDGAGLSLGVSVVPAYFRSQRQLIIDTEKLIREQKTLTPAAFLERSNNLGADQKILRLRYGKFLGEESETNIGPGPAGAEHHAGDGHDHEPAPAQLNSANQLLDPYIHKHDTEEDATYFEPAVKTQLKAALAHMWEAELQLRLSQPKAALPFEYKALRLLKEVQQKSRAYVRKMGFEPPVLNEAEKRLTGDLAKIIAPTHTENRSAKQLYPYIRQAMPWLAAQNAGATTTGRDAILLQQAGQELAAIAVQQPAKYLKNLRDLRKLITEVQAGKITCNACLTSVAAAFENVLPLPKPAPGARTINRNPLASQYFRNLK